MKIKSVLRGKTSECFYVQVPSWRTIETGSSKSLKYGNYTDWILTEYKTVIA